VFLRADLLLLPVQSPFQPFKAQDIAIKMNQPSFETYSLYIACYQPAPPNPPMIDVGFPDNVVEEQFKYTSVAWHASMIHHYIFMRLARIIECRTGQWSEKNGCGIGLVLAPELSPFPALRMNMSYHCHPNKVDNASGDRSISLSADIRRLYYGGSPWDASLSDAAQRVKIPAIYRTLGENATMIAYYPNRGSRHLRHPTRANQSER
jgi:hypothetical protein